MRALFPGSFTPGHPGHPGRQAVLRRAALLFDEVVVCVMTNSGKTGRLPVAERLERLRAAATGPGNVTVDAHTDGLPADCCRRAGIGVVVRGVRDVQDLDHEIPMTRMNRGPAGVETLFLADPGRAHISSTLVTAMGHAGPTTGP